MNALKRWVTLLIVLALVIVSLLVVTPTAVYACSCASPGPPEAEMARSTAVFAGKVTEIAARDWLVISSTDPVKVTFQVSEVWKGPVRTTLTARTARSDISCGYAFTVGDEYLVYANGSEMDLELFLCSRTAPLATAVSDLIVLGAGVIPGPGAVDRATPSYWLPTLFFGLLGLFLVMAGLFQPQLNRRLGIGQRSRLFTQLRLQRSARQTERLGQIVQVALGLGLLMQAVGRLYAPSIFNGLSLLFLGLAGIGILAILGITVRHWRA